MSDIWRKAQTCFSILLAISNKLDRMNELSLLIHVRVRMCDIYS